MSKADETKKSGGLILAGDLPFRLPGFTHSLPARKHAGHFTMLDQVNQLVAVRDMPPDIGFMGRLIALCSLPRTNPGDRTQYKRVNGPITLYMLAGGETKLPYGNIPRLLLAWVCTEAVRTQSPHLVMGRSLAEFMRKLGMEDDSGGVRGDRTRLRNQMKRLFLCVISLTYKGETGGATLNAPIAREFNYMWSARDPNAPSLWNSKIELGADFFKEIIRRPVPLDMNILREMKRSPLGLDLYFWLVYKTFTLKTPQRFEWRHLYRQFGVDPARSTDSNIVNAFRTDCLRELTKLKAAWPDLRYRPVKGRLVIEPSRPRIAPTQLRLRE